MKIINETDLNYQYIGFIIDKIQEMGKNDTHYFGQVEITTIEIKGGRKINVQIRYLKRYCEFRFSEVYRKEGQHETN